jgi:tetratricopeptide (TPR) repeat protein
VTFARFALACLSISSVLLCQSQDAALREAARLDSEQKCDEAQGIYEKLLAKGTPSAALINNVGNHYLGCGAPDKARLYFERLIKINPGHINANLQLARLAVGRKQGRTALEYLSRIKQQDPEILLVRAEALSQAGKRDEAAATLDSLAKVTGSDPRLLFAIGMSCGRIGLYDRAENAFNAVLVQYPDDYDVLYNFGLAAARAEHYERAQSAFEVALRVRPDDVDALVALGRAESHLGDHARAVYLLAQARKLAPGRPEVLLALGQAAQAASFFGDAVLAFDEYLKLRPDDEVIRRERAFTLGYGDAGRAEGVKELTAYVRRHPKDAIGYFELAQISYHADRLQALEQISTAVRLNPAFEPAHFVRAWLLHRLGREEEALTDLRVAIRLNPGDALGFDELGLVYMNLDRPEDAEKALRQAVSLSPNEPSILVHLARALVDSGHAEEAQPYFERFRKAQPEGPLRPREEAGIIETASMLPAERASRTIEHLKQLVQTTPNDPSLKLSLGSLLLLNGKPEEAEVVFRDLLALSPASVMLQKAGETLLAHERYAVAGEMLRRAVAQTPAANLDLAIAIFYTDGPQAALKVLKTVPDAVDHGDALLMKAKILDAAGHPGEADQLIGESMGNTISRPVLAEESVLLLLRHGQAFKALQLVGEAMISAPNDPELMLVKAAVLSALHRDAEAVNVVKEIESRWAEWDRAYVMQGLLLEREGKLPEARRSLQIAIALGTGEAAAQCALTRMNPSPDSATRCSCQPGVYESFFPSCQVR